ncbi:c-type cytochrome [Mesorhizobium sp.]|uniref:c-type cytochrome n=1 Tax=Mesorhizobium sp. TaxID=1871066 RepID=UPI003BAC8B4E
MNILRIMNWLARNRRDRMIGAVALICVGVLVGLLAFVFIALGGVDVAADKPHSWLTYQLLHFSFNRAVSVRSSEYTPPADLNDPWRVRLGAQQFHLVCSNCHGGPGLGQSPIALSMQPRPQSLPAVVKQFDDKELFWIVKHGVKFSAMPSWPNQTRDDEVWSMVAFLKKLPSMSADTYLDMTRSTSPGEAGPKIPFNGPRKLTDADTRRNTYPSEEFLYASPSIGFGDQGLMTDPVTACSRCHGKDGTGSATGGEAPNLTIQSAAYLAAALKAYAAGDRKSGFMQPVAAALSESQITALASYYSGLTDTRADEAEQGQAPIDPKVLARGKAIALEGLRTDAMPACAMCHDSAAGARISAPHLKGQARTYLRRQLLAMRDGDRGWSAPWNPMPAEAHYLTDDDINAVASYYANEAPAGDGGALPALPSATASDIAAATAMFEKVCATCHTRQAIGDKDGEAPNLTIQTAAYTAQALRSYRAGVRDHVKMELAARDLTESQVDALATYIGGLSPMTQPVKADQSSVERGARIARSGIAERGVPACQGCHNPDLTSAIPLIARLEGQNAVYLRRQLDYFSGPEADRLDALNPMPAIARALSSQDQADLAAYFATQPPLPKAAAAN